MPLNSSGAGKTAASPSPELIGLGHQCDKVLFIPIPAASGQPQLPRSKWNIRLSLVYSPRNLADSWGGTAWAGNWCVTGTKLMWGCAVQPGPGTSLGNYPLINCSLYHERTPSHCSCCCWNVGSNRREEISLK